MYIFTSVNLTKPQKISINVIDKIAKVCYTKNKLENKIKNLTNNKQKQKGKQKMAETLKLPTEVWRSNVKDDVDVDYAIYGDNEKQEREYIAPNKVSKKSIEMIKSIDLRQRFENRGKKLLAEVA